MKATFILFVTLGLCSAAYSQSAVRQASSVTVYEIRGKSGPGKEDVVYIHPNPSTDGTIQVVSRQNGELHFYIFDLEGTMVHQSVFKNKQKQTIQNLPKGIYTYNVFANDESIEEGKLTIK
jgi:hypothetical protein